MRRLAALCCLFASATLAPAALAPAHAQSRPLSGGTSADTPLRPATTAVAFTNARVVVAPGRVLERATVVLRDGRIESVGARVAVPFDARRIAADSLTVYAGFVDAFSTAGVAAPPEPERYTGDPGVPPRERAGVTPDRDVRALYDATDARIEALRNAGFTLAHVAPRDGLFSGRGALVSLRAAERGETTADLFVRGPASLVARIDGASGVYPATPMGVLAVMRERVENARRRDRSRGDARGDAFDPVADALDDVIGGDLPFWFVAGDALGAFRALRASREMGLAPVLAGLTDVRPVLDAVRAERVPVVLSLALADTVAADSLRLSPMAPRPGPLAAVRVRRTRDYRDVPAERAALVDARRAAIARQDAAAATLAEARVPFSLGTFGADAADLLPHLRRLVRAGLAPDDALAALTTSPARLFGVERLVGTVEPGRLADLVVTDGPLFADSTRLRYVLVDGVVHEIKKPSAGGAADSAGVVAVGTWRYEGAVPDGVRGGTFVISRAGASLSGTLIADGAPYALSAVALDGATLSFDFSTLGGDTARVSGTITGDRFAGTVDGLDGGSVALVATRLP